jgi:hypothetical protein
MTGDLTAGPGAGAWMQIGPGPRLLVLHLISRRVLTLLLGFVVCAFVLRLSQQLGWIPSSGLVSRLVPLTIEAVTAVLLATSMRSPFGELENKAGSRIVYLRASAIVLGGATAVGAMVAAAAGTSLPGGDVGVLRDTAGLIGIALLCGTVFGGSFSWTGPLVYLIIAQQAINAAWMTPWVWPARPAHDRDAALCAVLALAVGLIVATLVGTREPKSD